MPSAAPGAPCSSSPLNGLRPVKAVASQIALRAVDGAANPPLNRSGVGEDEPAVLPSRSAARRRFAPRPRPVLVDLKVFGPGARTLQPRAMTEEAPPPRFREHLHEMREALAGIGRDVELDVADAPHVAKEGTKNVLARAAGIRRTPMREWTEPTATDEK